MVGRELSISSRLSNGEAPSSAKSVSLIAVLEPAAVSGEHGQLPVALSEGRPLALETAQMALVVHAKNAKQQQCSVVALAHSNSARACHKSVVFVKSKFHREVVVQSLDDVDW